MITSKELLHLFKLKSGKEVAYSELCKAMSELRIRFKNKVIHNMKISAYLDTDDVRRLSYYFAVALYRE